MANHIALPENLLDVASVGRTWNGVDVEITEFFGSGRVLHKLAHADQTRLGMMLDEVGEGRSEPRLRSNTPCPVDYKPRQMHYTPAGMELWGYSEHIRYARDINLCFDIDALGERCDIEGWRGLADTPRLRFNDDGIFALINLLVDAVQDPDPSAQLYGDALVTAIAIRLYRGSQSPVKGPTRLSPLQLNDALGFLEANLPSKVDLATLAKLAGLSQSHYHRAFKASTGLAPYAWQLQARIERSKALLLDTSGSLEDVAEATGFADAVHFGRTFRKLTGATPAAWRRDRFN
ncbi:helix-turn-helix domain-containing protein [Pseudoduganella plicata]|uniref:AraC family transcriptional regulator n=1 Tax=Pseudoduganella plicata TaxID=321984 RepID=A0A4P7BC32_9BURK|nr:AraC family transcriptional regulator [Pseudoduganella plicata]QBQ35532.1 AraC family transcriptional regulator [Pseudoduganella plicata]GGY97098.1 AraC family transcriptional regulator [Pseudoduganella plicata]